MSETEPAYFHKRLIFDWNYYDAEGKLIGHVQRYENVDGQKTVIPFFRLNAHGYAPGIDDKKLRPLFGLHKLTKHPKDKLVLIPEGEKSAAALQGLNLCAITSLGGSQGAGKADWGPVSGREKILLLPDNDSAGETYMRDVYRLLMGLPSPPAVKVLRLPDLSAKGDIIDWLQAKIDAWDSFETRRDYLPWDGYRPIDSDFHDYLKDCLKSELKKSQPVPDEWNLAILAGSDSSVFDWEKPNAIQTKTPAVQALSTELIPEPFRAWVGDVAYRMQTPADFACISAIVIAGSVIGAGCSIRPKRLDYGFEVVPNLWGACIGRPSIGLKSPSMKEPITLLDRLQAEYAEQYESEMTESGFDDMMNKVNMDAIKSQAAAVAKGEGKDYKVDKNAQAKLKADYLELMSDATPEPVRRLFKTNETSIQSMTLLQKQNSRGLLVFRDELIGLLVKWDREDGADERSYFLEGWNGNGSYTDYKIGRGLTDAKAICISLLGGIQPDKLKRYLYQALQGNNDGLMQRLQLAVWPDEPDPDGWELVDILPNKAEKDRVNNIIKTLADLDFIQCGARQSEYDDRPHFNFDEAGQIIFNQFWTELQKVKIKEENNPLMLEHLGKYRSLMPSLALIFHCIDIANGKAQGNVSAKAASLAVQWCRYLESHARRIYAMAESPEHEAAVRLADRIREKGLPDPFTSKVVYDKNWHGLKEKEEVDAACNILIDENWIRMIRKPASGMRGRPPLPEYFINPLLLV